MPLSKSQRSPWRIGEILLQKDWISWPQLASALGIQGHQGTRRELLGEILVNEKAVNRRQILRALAIQCGIPFLELDSLEIEHDVLTAVPAFFIRRYRFLPIDKGKEWLSIAVSNPFNFFLLALLSESTGYSKIRISLAVQDDIEKAIRRYYGASFESAA